MSLLSKLFHRKLSVSEKLDRLNHVLMNRDGPDAYRESIQLISDLDVNYDAFYVRDQVGPDRLAAFLAFALVAEDEALRPDEIISPLRDRFQLGWWLGFVAADVENHSESVRRLAARDPAPAPVGADLSATRDGETAALLRELGRRDLLGPNPAIARLQEKGEAVVPELLHMLEGNDIAAAEDAIGLLGAIGDLRAIPRLRGLRHSQWAEISRAALTALVLIERRTGKGLHLERDRARGQVGELWTAIFQGGVNRYSPDELNAFCVEAIAAMPELRFDSKDDEARIWGMLGSLLYKSLHPEWRGEYFGMEPCPEAKRCCEEAFRCDGYSGWKSRAESIPDPVRA